MLSSYYFIFPYTYNECMFKNNEILLRSNFVKIFYFKIIILIPRNQSSMGGQNEFLIGGNMFSEKL